MKWFVLYTKPNFEIRVSKALNSIGIKAFCPTYKKIIQYSDRKKKVEKPLLPSYVLVYTNEESRSKVFEIHGVIRYVFWLGKPAEVRAKEIEQLRSNLSGIIKNISILNLKKGTNYVIPEGPFKGNNGKVVEVFKNRLKLELTGLGLIIILTTA